MERFDKLIIQLYEATKRIERAYRQIFVLNERLEDIQKRYEKAILANRKSFRYTLRIRIVAYEGMINAYFEYAAMKKTEVKNLRIRLFGENDELSEYVSSEDDSVSEYFGDTEDVWLVNDFYEQTDNGSSVSCKATATEQSVIQLMIRLLMIRTWCCTYGIYSGCDRTNGRRFSIQTPFYGIYMYVLEACSWPRL